MTDTDPYVWRDPCDGVPPSEVVKAIAAARERSYAQGRRDSISSSRVAAETRHMVHDDIVAYVASLHFKDTFEHHFLKLAMDSMKFVALNGYRAPDHLEHGGDG